MMRRDAFFLLLFGLFATAHAQQTLTLERCRELALQNNKQINISKTKQDIAHHARKAMRTKYLPKVDVVAGYDFTSREISLLSNDQKATLSNMGTAGLQQIGGAITSGFESQIGQMVGQGMITAEQALQLGAILQQMGTGTMAQQVANAGNAIGQQIVKGFRTDTRNLFGGAVIVRQPIYMGGAIVAGNRMADITNDMAVNDLDLKTQATLYEIDRAYWMIVSLKQKQKLANSYRHLVKKLDDDVQKMIKQGVATRADGLKVDVKVNEADMQITQVDDGLSLAKMLLCQLCGLPMDKEITLADENNEEIKSIQDEASIYVPDSTMSCRPEIRMLQNAVSLSEQATKMTRAIFLPHVALTGGYMVSNPNVYNGFQNKFAGTWSVGVMVQVPVWNWGEGTYKVRASKSATRMAELELADIEEKINLQVSQSRFKVAEAQKRLTMTKKNISSAEENLRCAQVGFREGVIESTDVMAAQTAWQQAQSQKIDAEIEVKLSQLSLQKALGVLN